jgi:hypothetical protein
VAKKDAMSEEAIGTLMFLKMESVSRNGLKSNGAEMPPLARLLTIMS